MVTRKIMTLNIERTPQKDGIVVAEMGRNADGAAISLDCRLFMQLLAFGDCADVSQVQAVLTGAASEGDFTGALYADLHDPNGIALVACSESADYFIDTLRGIIQSEPFASLTPRPELTMFGRTYAIGYENDLEEAILNRPRRKIIDPNNKWAIWYPLRRSGTFEQLTAQEQRTVLMEHGGIGMAYGRAGHGTDIRLACHGLDRNDNDFVIALLGKKLAPLSKIVERMRKTKQTSQHLSSLGPFFIGRAIWQSNNS